jgi:hypothetical protein
VPEGSASAPQQAASFAKVDDLFLKLLDRRIDQGRRVYPATGRGYAPKEFEKDPDAGGVTARAFEAAMERLFSTKRIATVTSGPASKRTTYLARSEVSADA